MKTVSKKLVCVSASTQFYTKGDIYQVYADEDGYQCVRGYDGDRLATMSSKFGKYNETTIS